MDQNKSLVVGIITFLMFSVIASLFIWQSDIFRKVSGYELVGRFQNISGLIDGSAVRYRGYGVGHVVAIKPKPDYIDVIFFLDGDIKVPKGSNVKVMFDGLVGENYLQIIPDPKQAVFLGNKDIIYGQSGSDLANFIDIGSQNLVQTEQILAGLKNIVSDKAFFAEIKGIVENLNSITYNLAKISQRSEFSTVIENVDISMLQLRSILDRLSQDEMVGSLESSAVNFNRFSKFLSDEERLKRFDRILANVEGLSDGVNSVLGGDSARPSLFARLNQIELSSSTRVLYNSQNNFGYFDSNIAFSSGRFGLIGGVGNVMTDEIKFQHFQQSFLVVPALRTRLGVVYNTEGVGVDIYPSKRLIFSADYFDFSNTSYRISSGVRIYDHLRLETSYRKDSKVTEGSLDVGLNLLF